MHQPDGGRAMDAAIDVDGCTKTSRLSLLELFAGELTVNPDADDVVGGHSGLLKGANRAEHAIVIACVDQESLGLGNADDRLRRRRESFVERTRIIGNVDNLVVGDAKRRLQRRVGGIVAVHANRKALHFDRQDERVRRSYIAPTERLVELDDAVANLLANRSGLKSDEGRGIA